MAEVNIALPRFSAQQISRFWQRVDKSPGQGPQGECWEWRGQRWQKYGKLCFKVDGKLHGFRAHRIARYIDTGSIRDVVLRRSWNHV